MSTDGATILFGLPWVRVAEVVRDEVLGRVVHVVIDEPGGAACPVCGVFSVKPRQRRTTRPRDLPQGEEPLLVRWKKTQRSCLEASYPRKAFTESIRELPPRARVTGRLRRAARGGRRGELGQGGVRLAVPGLGDRARCARRARCRPSSNSPPGGGFRHVIPWWPVT